MTIEELEQIRRIIREETVSKEDLKASEERTKAEIKAEAEGLADDMAEFFHQTWAKMDETNERVTIIEDHLDLPHPTKN